MEGSFNWLDGRETDEYQRSPVIKLKRTSATAEIRLNVAIQGHSSSSVVVPIDAAYMTSY